VTVFAWLRRFRSQKLSDFSSLEPGRVELDGVVEPLATLAHPITGEACVALEYNASPPSGLSVHGIPHSSRAFTIKAVQSLDFVLFDGARRVLVRVPDEQDDVALVHRHLTDQHGLRLRVEIGVVLAGTRVRVRGRASPTDSGSAYRTVDYVAVVDAEAFWELGKQ
jgi:hypothetical protein